jgi:hypothetical protein
MASSSYSRVREKYTSVCIILIASSKSLISPIRSAIIEEIKGMRTTGLATMAYYHFDIQDVKKQDRYGLLSSIVSQLSAQLDSCYKVLSQLFSNHAGGTRKPTTSSLTKCMKDMLSLSGLCPIYIVVDALDECPNFPGRPSTRDEVLELIKEFVDLKLPNLHLCVASRPEMDIRTVLEPLTTLKISLDDESGQTEHTVTIRYIESVARSVQSMRTWKEEDKQLVVNRLSGTGARASSSESQAFLRSTVRRGLERLSSLSLDTCIRIHHSPPRRQPRVTKVSSLPHWQAGKAILWVSH